MPEPPPRRCSRVGAWHHCPRVKTKALVSCAVLCLSLASCSSSSRQPVAAVTPDVPLTALNAEDAIRAGYRAPSNLLRVARTALGFLLQTPPGVTPPGTGAVFAEVAGPEGGTATVQWTDLDGNEQWSTGDEVAIGFNAYGEGGAIYDGSVQFDGLRIVGDPAATQGRAWLLSARLEFVTTRISINGVVTPLDGSVVMSFDTRAILRVLTLDFDRPFQIGTRTILAGTSLVRTESLSGPVMVLLFDGAIEDPVLGGVLALRTEAALTGVTVLPDPSTGEFVIAGAGGSQLIVNPVDLFNVEVHVDENGDEEIEEVLALEWSVF